jgi:hypothetical protein
MLFIEINDTYYILSSTLIHSPFLYMLIEVVLFPLHMSTPNQIPSLVPPTCIAFIFIVTMSILVLLIIF